MTPLSIDHWRRLPATLLLLALSAAGFLLVSLPAPLEWLAAVTFTPFRVASGELVFGSAPGQYWRYLTPLFLHFGWLHIVFNCLWVWLLGGKLALYLGAWPLLALVVLIGAGSNGAQHLLAGPALFGGMSGVVYGLLGFSWVYGHLKPMPALRLSAGVLWFMLGWLLFCVLAPTEVLGFGSIANTAHVSGLLLGAGSGLVALGWSRTRA